MFGSSVFQCIKCVTTLRKDSFGEAKSEARMGMLREVAEIISGMAKPPNGTEPTPGRDGKIYTNSFPVEPGFVKTLTSLKQTLITPVFGRSKSNVSNDDLFRELDHG